ncbi:hypothetical protein AB0D08_00525 [Kitasatospora sp. NPDC048540]|uniref:hypothetical protein n=1 Tax=Kitasatospora sp. NPDC048540 TaxID=3155634 RepID=UPI0033E9D98C
MAENWTPMDIVAIEALTAYRGASGLLAQGNAVDAVVTGVDGWGYQGLSFSLLSLTNRLLRTLVEKTGVPADQQEQAVTKLLQELALQAHSRQSDEGF